jgi:hypothetical protein
MPLLRCHRRPRNHRARAPKQRKRRNLVKFIPEADSDFAHVARNVFLCWLKRDPQRYGVTIEQINEIDAAVTAFRSALAKTEQRHTRNPQLTGAKDVARANAEAVVRRYANIIRANPDVTDTSKKLLRIKVRPEKLSRKKCPTAPPRLQFIGSGDGVIGGIAPGSGSGVHVLKFWNEYDSSTTINRSSSNAVRRAKPDGAVRVELYFDMIPAGEPVPQVPFERGWPKYLRSFTKSPMEVEFPVPSQPMLIVYWAKWADSTGETSRWSKTCVARVEGWSATAPALPDTHAHTIKASHIETKYIIVQAPHLLPEHLEHVDLIDERRMLPEQATNAH